MTDRNIEKIEKIEKKRKAYFQGLRIYVWPNKEKVGVGGGDQTGEKRFYTRGTLRGMIDFLIGKNCTLFNDCLRSVNKKRVDYFSCIEEKGV